jgi:hypothetical protein
LAKLALGLFLGLALAVFVLIVDLGVNAGRIHYGVSVGTVDVGGLTEAEATEVLKRIGEKMKTTPVVFSRKGVALRLVPTRVGWGPQPSDSAQAAMAVGRSGGVLTALADRLRAWFGGARVGWAGSPDAKRVGKLLNRWQRRAQRAGLGILRAELRYKIRRVIQTWPRKASYRIPITRQGRGPS